MNLENIPSPCYVMDEKRFRNNLEKIREVKEKAGVEIILALKAFAMWSVFPVMKEYGFERTTASSPAEAELSFEQMGTLTHSYTPAYTDRNIADFIRFSSHITFNSVSQYARFKDRVRAAGISCGLRINPRFSLVDTDLYNPSAPGSRLGVTAEQLVGGLPEGIEGLHVHNLCESSPYDLEKMLAAVEENFGHYIPQVKWLNLGGGHLMTREGYDRDYLIKLLKAFKKKYSHLQVVLEPGSAFAWDTGWLVSTVEDIVENDGIRTAVLDVSFACHMPDCLEMPYKPVILGAEEDGKYVYRMGGNSCLAGDFFGDWSFVEPLKAGDRMVFNDMIHYTMVKTTMFNGVSHPSIGIVRPDGRFELIREFGYPDYKGRLS